MPRSDDGGRRRRSRSRTTVSRAMGW